MSDRKEQGRLQLYHNQGFEEGGNRPRFSGSGYISKAMLKSLIDQFKDGTNVTSDGDLKVDCTGWDNVTKGTGAKYIGVTFEEAYSKPNEDGQSSGGGAAEAEDDFPF